MTHEGLAFHRAGHHCASTAARPAAHRSGSSNAAARRGSPRRSFPAQASWRSVHRPPDRPGAAGIDDLRRRLDAAGRLLPVDITFSILRRHPGNRIPLPVPIWRVSRNWAAGCHLGAVSVPGDGRTAPWTPSIVPDAGDRTVQPLTAGITSRAVPASDPEARSWVNSTT